MAGDVNAKHSEWNSVLITATAVERLSRQEVLLDQGACFSNHVYTHGVATDILDIIVKDLVVPVHLAVCSALNSDDLSVLIGITCR
jgi:hypothetical protein